ncbi:COMT [Symbiodinium sp. CCMP2456]|nr:COMT [Symbiodinium sp. CCMP2456]
MHNVPDWMTASIYSAGGPPESLARQAPPSIRKLEWDAERMRSRSHQPQYGGSGVDFEQWLAFAESMRTAMCQALPVKTIPFSDSSAPLAMHALMAKPQGQECSSGSSSSKK